MRKIGSDTVTGNITFSNKINITGTLNVSGPVNGLNKSMVGLDQVDNASDINKPISTATQSSLTALGTRCQTLENKTTNQSYNSLNLTTTFSNLVNFTGTVSGITKTMVGLDQVDNTSDINKPISTATQTSLTSLQTRATTLESKTTNQSFNSSTSTTTFSNNVNFTGVIVSSGITNTGIITSTSSVITTGGLTINGGGINVTSGGISIVGGLTLDCDMNMFNGKVFYSKNTAGAVETFLIARWTDNATYLNYGSAGFYIRNNAGTTTINVTNDNKVGIGTTTPATTLEVKGTTSYASMTTNPMVGGQIITTNTGSQRLILGAYYTGGAGSACAIQSSDFYSGFDHFQNLLLNPNGGNVGIGLSAPAYMLDVFGAISSSSSGNKAVVTGVTSGSDNFICVPWMTLL